MKTLVCLLVVSLAITVVATAYDKVCELETTDEYAFHYHTSAIDPSRYEFSVKAHNDAHIALSTQPADAQLMYKIAIGGWGNTKSVIRRCNRGCGYLTKYYEADIVSEEEFREFWISFDVTTGRLAVGKQGEEDPFMVWKDPNPIPVQYVGFSTGFGTTGTFRYPCSVCELETTDEYAYHYQTSAIDPSRYEFSVKAHNDAHIALSTQPADATLMYVIVVGGWENARSAIRRCNGLCGYVTKYPEAAIVSEEEFREFWISYDVTTGRLAVGKQGEEDPFMVWTDPNPIAVQYVGFSTGFGSTGTFRYPC